MNAIRGRNLSWLAADNEMKKLDHAELLNEFYQPAWLTGDYDSQSEQERKEERILRNEILRRMRREGAA